MQTAKRGYVFLRSVSVSSSFLKNSRFPSPPPLHPRLPASVRPVSPFGAREEERRAAVAPLAPHKNTRVFSLPLSFSRSLSLLSVASLTLGPALLLLREGGST